MRASIALASIASQANAGGFLADTFIRPISPKAADAADAANRRAGQPVDQLANRAAGAAVGYYAGPAAGAATTAALEARRRAQNGQ